MFEPGNKLGEKSKVFGGVLRRAIAQDDGKRLRMAAEKLLDLASEGEQWAVRELFDRLDGKAAQSVAVTGEDGGPVQFEKIVRQIVDPKGD